MTEKKDDMMLGVFWNQVPRAPQEPDQPAFGQQAGPQDLVIGTSKDRILVIIKPNGELLYGPEYRPQEAAQIFWEHMAQRRLMVEDKFLLVQHMEAILVQLGRFDMECERLRKAAEAEPDYNKRAELTQSAEFAIGRLEMVVSQAIELGRALVKRPEVMGPSVPSKIPDSVRSNQASDYKGREALPIVDDEEEKPETD